MVEVDVRRRIITKGDKSCTRATKFYVESSNEALDEFNLPVKGSSAYGIRHVKDKSHICIAAIFFDCCDKR